MTQKMKTCLKIRTTPKLGSQVDSEAVMHLQRQAGRQAEKHTDRQDVDKQTGRQGLPQLRLLQNRVIIKIFYDYRTAGSVLFHMSPIQSKPSTLNNNSQICHCENFSLLIIFAVITCFTSFLQPEILHYIILQLEADRHAGSYRVSD